MTRTVAGTVRRFARPLIEGRLFRATPEVALYAIGAGMLFYAADFLLMRWQGLSLH